MDMLVCEHCRAATPRFRLSSLRLPVRSSLGDHKQVLHMPSTASPLQKIHSGPNSRSLSAAVIRLRKAELVQEMQLRGLPETGSRHDLRERLLQAIQAEQRRATDAGTATKQEAPSQGSHEPCQPQPRFAAYIQASRSTVLQTAQQTQDEPGNRQPGTGNSIQDHVKQDISTANSPPARQSVQTAINPNPPASTRQIAGQQPSTARSSKRTPPPNMSVTWLGTSSGSPSMRRNVSSIALRHGPCTHLVDCGEGSSRQILRSHINPASICGIYISHLHGDHCFGLPGVIELVSRAHQASGTARGSQQLTIQGPPGIQQLVKSALAASMSALHMRLLVRDYTLDKAQARDPTPVDPTGLISFARQAPDADSEPITNPAARSKNARNKHSSLQAHNIPVVPGLAWTAACEGGMTVTAAQLQHRLPCWGYVFQEAPSQGLQGRKVVLLGDTCDSQAITAAGMGADMVSHECTFAAGMEKKAYVAQHSTAPMAGKFARSIHARALVLTHFSNRYSNRGELPGQELAGESEGDRQDVLQWLMGQAKEAFGSNRVWAANDFYTFDVRHHSASQAPTHER
ncbi:hypothetical protein ABBQ38_008374 [Trebouxia sp. C0009 RCD-2024]